jgi:GNAT superfamily N-acetyltransferase
MALVRLATEQDAVGIAHVHVQSWRTTYVGIVPNGYLEGLDEAERALLWRERLASDLLVYVAELQGRVVGFASGGPMREALQTYDGEVYALYLLQEAQGQGIGTALLYELAGALLDEGFVSMAAWVLEENPAIEFYMKSGALPITSRKIEIGGAQLSEVAVGWPDLAALRLLQ